MPALTYAILRTGLVAGLVSGAAVAAFSRMRNARATPALNAVSHIAWGGTPPGHDGRGKRNLIVGSALHLGASVFWAALFETLFGRVARKQASAAWVGAAITSATAYCTDYHVVPRRLRPGMERFLTRRALYGVYAALAAGFILAARSDRRTRHGEQPLPEVSAATRLGHPGKTQARSGLRSQAVPLRST